MSIANLALQLPPASVVLVAISERWADWPSLRSQVELAQQFANPHISRYPPPPKGWRFLFKSIEKDVMKHCAEQGLDEDGGISDDLVELIVQAQCAGVDENDTGFLSFPSVTSPEMLVPIKVIQSHNQVGTKVWGAGVYLAELFQRVPNLMAQQTVLELGAGVGITGLLIACATPKEMRPSKVIMTDFHHSVVDLLAENIKLNTPADIPNPCVLEADTLDWATVEASDYLRYNATICFAADCTYSESGNVNLVAAFKLFLHTMSSRTADAVGSSDDTAAGTGSYCERLVQTQVPFILIACTVRNPATYAHFRSLLREDAAGLQVEDLTQWAAAQFPAVPTYFYPDDRGRIELLCIHLRTP